MTDDKRSTDLTILIDENVETIDRKMLRVSHCAVEVADSDVLEGIIEIVPQFRRDTVRFGDVKKFHFSELSEGQRTTVIDTISKLNVSAKVYVYYKFNDSEKNAKISSMVSTVNHLKYIHRNKDLKFLIESALEYKSDKVLKPMLVSDENLFIVPDGFLSVFMGMMNNTTNRRGANDRMYVLIKEKIRLQVFNDSSASIYLDGTNKL